MAWPEIEERLGRPGVELAGLDGAVVAEVETGLVPVGIVARPQVDEGRLTLEPAAVRIGGRELSGALAERLLARMGDRADLLGDGLELPTPAGLTLTAARGVSEGLDLTLDLAPGPLGAGLGQGGCSAAAAPAPAQGRGLLERNGPLQTSPS